MSVELAAAYVSIIPSTRGLAAQVRREVGQPLEDAVANAGVAGGQGFTSNLLSSSVAGLDRLGGKIVSTVTTGAKIAAAAGAAIIATGLAGGLRRVLDTEDATIAFRQMGLDLQEIDRVMQQVDRTFDGTPFANPDGFNITAQLIASGRSLADVEQDLRNIANVTSQTLDKDLQRTSETFLRIAATGRVYATDLNSLAMQGIPIRNILAEALNVTVAELNDMVSAGEVTFDMLMDVIGATERFDGAAQAMGSSTRGAFQNVLTGVARLGESFLGPLFGENGHAVRALQSIRDALRDLTPVADELGQKFADWLIPAVGRAADYFSDVLVPALRDGMEWFDRNRDMIGQLAAAIVPAVGIVGALATAVHLAGVALKILGLSTPVGIIMALVAALVYAWQNSETFRDIVTSAWETIQRVVTPIIDWLIDAVGRVVDWWNDLGVSGATLSETVSNAWQRIRDAVAPVVDWFQTHVGPVMSSLGEFISEVWDWVQTNIRIALALIRAHWDAIGEPFMAVLNAAWENAKSTVQAVWEVILTVIETTLAVISGVLDAFTALMRGDWEAFWNAIWRITANVTVSIRRIIDTFVDWMRRLMGILMDAVVRLWQAGWERVRVALVNAWNRIRTAVSAGRVFVQTMIRTLMNTVTNLWSNGWNRIIAFLLAAWGRIRAGVRVGVNNLMTIVRGIPGRVLGALANLPTQMYNAGRRVIQRFIDGISSMVNSVAAPVRRVASTVSSFFPMSPAKEGPLSGRGHTLFAGQRLAEDFAKGVSQRRSLVEASITELVRLAQLETDLNLSATAVPQVPQLPPVAAPRAHGNVTFEIHGDDPRTLWRARQMAKDYL